MTEMKNKKGKTTLNFLLVFLWIFSTAFFIWQHSTGLSWDFMSYTLNAKYFLSQGAYFEWYRPPLTSFLIGIFSVFGWKIAEYFFIISVSSLYFFSSIKLAEKFNINKEIFYALSITPFLLINSMYVGTELLSFALLQLFIAYIGDKKAPFFLALATLTRYNLITFFPLLLLSKNLKKFFRDTIIFIGLWLPWLVFNFISTGNPIASLMDSYALNIKFRGYMTMPFDFSHLLMVIGFLSPFFIVGIYYALKGQIEKKKLDIPFLTMFFVIALTIFSYAKIPFKTSRYLFDLTLPAAYFSVISICKIKSEQIKKGIVYILIISSIISVYIIAADTSTLVKLENPSNYTGILPEISPYVKNCALASNAWVHLNYLYKITTESAPSAEILDYKINQGYRVLLFKHITEPSYTFDREFIKKFQILKENERYILLGKEDLCADAKKADKTYLESMTEFYKIGYNESFHISAYELLFTDKSA